MVQMIRELSIKRYQSTVSDQQAKSIKRRPPGELECTSRFSLPAPKEDDVLVILLQAIKELGDGGEDFPVPCMEPVDVEWVGPSKYSDHGQSLEQGRSPRSHVCPWWRLLVSHTMQSDNDRDTLTTSEIQV